MSGGVSKSTYKYVAIVLATIGVVGLIFNLLVIVIIIMESKHSWTPTNVVLLNLAVSLSFFFFLLLLKNKFNFSLFYFHIFSFYNQQIGDFLVAVFGNPFALISALNHDWYWSTATCRW